MRMLYEHVNINTGPSCDFSAVHLQIYVHVKNVILSACVKNVINHTYKPACEILPVQVICACISYMHV
jgi:hypothetical protein